MLTESIIGNLNTFVLFFVVVHKQLASEAPSSCSSYSAKFIIGELAIT